MKNSLKSITVTGIGIALFVVLTLCLQVPVFQNYYLCLGYLVMAVYCFSVGTLSGTITGVFGVAIYCLLTGGLRGMPGWALGNIAIGIAVGLAAGKIRSPGKNRIGYLVWIIASVAGTAAGILGIKSLIDSLIRSQPFLVRVGMNIYAFIADAFVLIIALPLCLALDPHIKKILNK